MCIALGDCPPLRCSGAPLKSGRCPLQPETPAAEHMLTLAQKRGAQYGGKGGALASPGLNRAIDMLLEVWQCLPRAVHRSAHEAPICDFLQHREALFLALPAREDTPIVIWADPISQGVALLGIEGFQLISSACKYARMHQQLNTAD